MQADERFQQLIKHCRLQPGGRVLDIGGDLSAPCSRYLIAGSYDGLDTSPERVQRLRHAHCFRPGFRFRLLDRRQGLGPLPYVAGSYDLVACMELLNHSLFPAAAELVTRSGQLLQYDGYFSCTVKLLNHHSMAHLQGRFGYRTPESWHKSRHKLLRDVALPEEGFRRVLIRARLQICEPVSYGDWSHPGGGQADFLIARKL